MYMNTKKPRKKEGRVSKAAIALIKAEDKYYIYSNGKTMQGFPTVAEGLSYFERGYMSAHGRGYEGSMSATVNYMQFQISILMGDIKLLKKLSSAQCFQLNAVSGNMYGCLCDRDPKLAQELWDKGIKPQLIKDI